MSLVRLFKEKKTPEEIQQAREARKNVYAYITGATANLVNAVKANTITPETSKECSSLLTAEKKWLDSNTDADTQDIVSRYDVLNDKIKTLITNDKPRLIFKNSLLVYDTVFKASLQQGKITKEQYDKLNRVITAETAWYDKNVTVASELDFNNELQKMNDDIKAGGIDAKVVKDVAADSKKSTTELKESLVKKAEAEKKAEAARPVTFESGSKVVLSTAWNVFWTCLLVVLAILSGSFAANLAIGRPPIYRFLFFLYGMLPQFAPFILLYTLYKRFTKGPIPMYAILPVSIEMATTTFGKYLWYPFYWVPDEESNKTYKEFQESLEAAVAVIGPVVNAHKEESPKNE